MITREHEQFQPNRKVVVIANYYIYFDYGSYTVYFYRNCSSSGFEFGKMRKSFPSFWNRLFIS